VLGTSPGRHIFILLVKANNERVFQSSAPNLNPNRARPPATTRATQLTEFGTDQCSIVTCQSAKIRIRWNTATNAKIAPATVQNVLRFIERPSQAGTQSRYNDGPLGKLTAVELASKLPSRPRARLRAIYWGALALWAVRETSVFLSGSLGGLKPGSCYLKKDFALSLGVGSPSPTETFPRILVILPS
jgi:hypothetical protein